MAPEPCFVFLDCNVPDVIQSTSFLITTLIQVLVLDYKMEPLEHDCKHRFCIGAVSDLLQYVSLVYHFGNEVIKFRGGRNPKLWAHVDSEGVMCWFPDDRTLPLILDQLEASSRGDYAVSEVGSEVAKEDLAKKLEKNGATIVEGLFDDCERAADDMHLTGKGVEKLLENMKQSLTYSERTLILTDSSLVPHKDFKEKHRDRMRCFSVEDSFCADMIASEIASRSLGCSVRACSGSGIMTKDGGFARHLAKSPEYADADKVIFISSGNDYFAAGWSIAGMNKQVKYGIKLLSSVLTCKAEFLISLDHCVYEEILPEDYGFVTQQKITGEVVD